MLIVNCPMSLTMKLGYLLGNLLASANNPPQYIVSGTVKR